MDWISIGTGAMAAALIFALMNNDNQDEEYEEEIVEEGISINDSSGRSVKMSCQTCRKLKVHKEIEPNLWQCVRCKRQTDLRRKSG